MHKRKEIIGDCTLYLLVTIWACQLYRFLSHGWIITKYIIAHKEKYFDIACKRIKEAYEQPDLFVPAPVKHTQEELI